MHLLDRQLSDTTWPLPWNLAPLLGHCRTSTQGCIAHLHLPDLQLSDTTWPLPWNLVPNHRHWHTSSRFQIVIEHHQSWHQPAVRSPDFLPLRVLVPSSPPLKFSSPLWHWLANLPARCTPKPDTKRNFWFYSLALQCPSNGIQPNGRVNRTYNCSLLPLVTSEPLPPDPF